jgi:cysteinyl-tRNA synthetase
MIRRDLVRVLLVTASVFALTACDEVTAPAEGSQSVDAPLPRAAGRLSEVTGWAYQLQNISIDTMIASGFDLFVIDYADDEGLPFSDADIRRLQADGRVVLAYLSIGEAETYRPYWNPAWVVGSDDECDAALSDAAPTWLDPVNPEWCGNYPVQFWDPDWQAIIFNYLDAIQAAGFDGVYLDKVDTFYYWLGEEDLGASFTNPDAAARMAYFVATIARHGREQDAAFLIVPQNAAEIIEYLNDEQRAFYLATVDGIAAEDTFFYPRGGAETGENASYNPQDYIIELLDVYLGMGIPVFAVDYVTNPAKVDRFYEEAEARGYIPYATLRDLDRLTINTGHEP